MRKNKDKRKIALFIPNLEGGGAERVMVVLANSFVNRGFKVDLIVASSSGALKKLVSKDVKIVDLKVKRAFSAIPKLRRYIKENNQVVLMSFLGYANVIALLANLFLKNEVRHVISEREDIKETLKQSSVKRSFILKNLMKILYKKADKIIAISNQVASSLVEELNIERSNINVIYNPYMFDNKLSAESSEGRGIPKVISVGRLVPIKNFQFLLEVFKEVVESVDAELIILGEGHLRSKLEEQIEILNLGNKVKLMGFVNNPINYLNKADLFVIPSISEGFGNVVLEAMSCSLPIVSSKCGGPEEILENGKWGDIIDLKNKSEFVEKIINRLNKVEKIDYSIRLNDFSLDNIVNHYLEVLFEK